MQNITKSAGFFIINENGEILLGHPSYHKRNYYSIPKGKIEIGESELEAAIRETKEECNIDLNGVKVFTRLEEQIYLHKRKMLIPFVVFLSENDGIDISNIKCNSYTDTGRRVFPTFDLFKWININDAHEHLHKTQLDCLESIKKLIK